MRHLAAGVSALVMAAPALAGCGGDERGAANDTAGTSTRTQATTSAPTTPPEPPPERARSARTCAELWNADALPIENSQVSANEFVAKVAPVRVHVMFQRGDCFVVWPIGDGRIEYSSAPDGRRPFTNPDQRRLKSGERVPYNARADREGRVALD